MAGFENTSGLNVSTYYGPVSTPDGTSGSMNTMGAVAELAFEFSGRNINDGGQLDGFIKLPAGVRVVSAYVEVEEVFDLGGTSPTINIGTDGSASTNGVAITSAAAEAVGVYTDGDSSVSINGTWNTSAGLTAETSVSVELGGANPTATNAGKARVIVSYIKV